MLWLYIVYNYVENIDSLVDRSSDAHPCRHPPLAGRHPVRHRRRLHRPCCVSCYAREATGETAQERAQYCTQHSDQGRELLGIHRRTQRAVAEARLATAAFSSCPRHVVTSSFHSHSSSDSSSTPIERMAFLYIQVTKYVFYNVKSHSLCGALDKTKHQQVILKCLLNQQIVLFLM